MAVSATGGSASPIIAMSVFAVVSSASGWGAVVSASAPAGSRKDCKGCASLVGDAAAVMLSWIVGAATSGAGGVAAVWGGIWQPATPRAVMAGIRMKNRMTEKHRS